MNWEWRETWDKLVSLEHLQNLGIAVGIFLLFLLFRKLFTKYIFALLKRMAKRTKSSFLTNTLIAFEKPVQWLFIVLGINVAVWYYPYLNKNDAFETIISILIIILITWGLVNLSSTSSLFLERLTRKQQLKSMKY